MNDLPDRSVLKFVAGALVAIGWLMACLGGLCVFGVAIMASMAPGDWTIWIMPVAFFAAAGLCIWGGQRIRSRTGRRDGPP